MTIAKKAEALVLAGYAVFPVRADKTATFTQHGLKDATTDPFWAEEWFEKTRAPYIGIHCGLSGLVVLDIDYAEDENGNVVKDGYDALDQEWLEVPESFSYTSMGGHGKHILYKAPEGISFNGTGRYRGMAGVDRRAGESYIVFNSEEIPDKNALAPAPEWLCDASTVRSAEAFEGTVRDWYDSLEPGEPNALVRRAIEDIERQFAAAGNDFDHAALIESQFRAIRLGAEGNPGVDVLLGRIEELFFTREGSHSRPEEEWAHEFAEGLASGITRYGDAIDLRKNLPEYSPNLVPAAVPDRLITGAPGGKPIFFELLRTAGPEVSDDLILTSILWNSPRTRDIARDWGIEFTRHLVAEYRTTPEPVKENPSLAKPVQVTATKGEFLTADEMARATEPITFIDMYRGATNTKGFTNPVYAVPCAWEALSMAFGRRAFIPLAKTLEVNLWLIVLGESTTGKGTEDRFLRQVLDIMHYHEGDAHHYNLGALSSPDGLHLGLIQRDRKASIISNDEASDFFRDIRTKDWMAPVPDKASKWFDGYVEPSSKISLKDAKGKSALTSLNLMMWGTPDRLLELLDASQFESGFLARTNWVWDGTIPDPNRKSNLAIQENRESETPPGVFDVAADLTHATTSLPDRFAVSATPEAQARLNQAADDFRAAGRTSPRWSFIKPAIDRLVMETLWKCAALIAMYRGDAEFEEVDALIAIKHASEWLRTMMRVAESISESPYSRDLAEIEDWIASEGGEVTRAALLHNFRGKVVRSSRELEDRLQFLSDSGRVVAERDKERGSIYKLNR
jgi:Bifunctional DNA primase/polymerase, N-terminal